MYKVLHSKQPEECEARETRGAPLPRDSHEPGKEPQLLVGWEATCCFNALTLFLLLP